MDLIKEANRWLLNEQEEEWYHGTPDARELEKHGFQDKINNIDYVIDPEKFKQLQNELSKYKNDDDEYWKILDEISKLKKKEKFVTPVFLSNKYNVAKTYADPQRAFDYQGAKPKVFSVYVKPGKIVTINARGDKFKFIGVDKVRIGFINSGFNKEDIDKVINMFNYNVRDNSGIKTDTIAAIGNYLGVDIIDVVGVYDSYHGGNVMSDVRMVLNPKDIKIKNKENLHGTKR